MDVFASLEKEQFEEEQARSRALTAARVRAQDTYGTFLSSAVSKEDFANRLSLIDEDLRYQAKAVAAEYDYPGEDEVYDTAREFIAAEPHWEDSYQHKREDLPKATGGDSESVDNGPSPKIDKDKAGDVAGTFQEAIDVGSQRHPLTVQNASDHAEYNDADFDPDSPTRERVDASKPMQPEFWAAPNTNTWSGDKGDSLGQQDPVTAMPSGSVLSKYQLVEIM